MPVTRSARPAPPVTRRTGRAAPPGPGELVEPLDRRGVEDANEVPEVLADDDVVRHLERRLLAVALDQGRAIAPREQRDCERDRQECHRRHGRARPACKPDCCHARGQPAAAAVGAEAGERRQDPGDNESRGDRDEAGEKQEQQRRALSARQLLLVGGAAEERDGDDEHGCRSDQVERADTAPLARPAATR